MGAFGSKSPTPQELMKQYKREIDRACRELDREKRKLETQNTRLADDIKKAAAKGQDGVVRIMAKDYVRTKKHVHKFYQLRTFLQGVGLQIQTMKSVDAMAGAMKNATRALVQMNRRLNLPQLNELMRQFGVESERMEMTQEVMTDTMDGILEDDGEVEETEDVVKQVYAELHLAWADAPTVPVGTAAATATTAAPARVAAATGVGAGAGAGSVAGAGAGSVAGAGAGSGAPASSSATSGGGGGSGGGFAMPPPPPSSTPGSSSSGGGHDDSSGGGGGGGIADLSARLAALNR